MELRAALDDLGFDELDRDAVVAAAAQLGPAELARVDDLVARLAAGYARPDLGPVADPFTEADVRGCPAMVGLVPILALARVAPGIGRRHREQGYPDEVSAATLADLAQQVRVYRRVHGATGLDTGWWLACEVFAEGFARLGRLQFRLELGPVAAGGEPVPRLAIHVPGDGPLDPEQVDASLARASTFFEERWPQHAPVDWFTCTSWLLDPNLAWRLPGSNIADFARRFEVFASREHDRDALYFGFGVEPVPGAPVPPPGLAADSGLHRALLALWDEGEHVLLCAGSIPVIDQVDSP